MKKNNTIGHKVAIDARMINMSGIGTYIKRLMDMDIYSVGIGRKKEISIYNPRLDVIEFDEKIYGIKEQIKFPYKKVREYKPSVLHIPHYNVPLLYRGEMVVTIHDLTHIVCPEFLPNKFAYFYARFMIGMAIRKASVVLTVSECTKNDIMKYYKKVNPDKIIVTYEDISPIFHHKEKGKVEYLYDKFKIPKNKKILMYVGNLKPHKNLEKLIQAYSQIDNLKETVLILVGKAFDSYDLNSIEGKYGLNGQILHTGIVTDEELVDFYNLADLFAFPSIYEGFGLPPLEAMACGTPVIASNSSSMPEVLGEAAVYFEPTNVKQMTQAINQQLKVDKTDNELVQKGYLQVEYMKRKVKLDSIKQILLDN